MYDAVSLIDERLKFLRETEEEIRQLRVQRKILVEARKEGGKVAEGDGGDKVAAPVRTAEVKHRQPKATAEPRKHRQKGVKDAVLAALNNHPSSLTINEIAEIIPAAVGSIRAALNGLKSKNIVGLQGKHWGLMSTGKRAATLAGNAEDRAAA